MKRILSVLSLIIILASCSSSKKTTSGSGNEQTSSSASSTTTEDGLSYATAVVIHEKTENAGVNAEYAWIKKHYSGYKIKGQALTNHDHKPHDIITIELSDGKELKLYFDISKFFGKM